MLLFFSILLCSRRKPRNGQNYVCISAYCTLETLYSFLSPKSTGIGIHNLIHSYTESKKYYENMNFEKYLNLSFLHSTDNMHGLQVRVNKGILALMLELEVLLLQCSVNIRFVVCLCVFLIVLAVLSGGYFNIFINC